jgi:hypothetical protein
LTGQKTSFTLDNSKNEAQGRFHESLNVLTAFLPDWWARRSERERLLVAFALGQITMGIVVALTLEGKLGGPIAVNWLK